MSPCISARTSACSARRRCPRGGPPEGTAHDAIRQRLATGACFFTDLLADIGGIPARSCRARCGTSCGRARSPTTPTRRWDRRGSARRGRSRRGPTGGAILGAAGAAPSRRSRALVARFVAVRGSRGPDHPPPHQAELLLELGIVTREQVLAEGIPGGFSRSTTSSPRWRRRRGAARLLHRGPRRCAVRAARARSSACAHSATTTARPPIVLAATDPAQPYGAVLRGRKRRPAARRARGRRLRRAGRRRAGDLRRARRQGPADPGRGQRPAPGRRHRRARRRRPPRPHQAPGDRARRRRAGRRLRVGGRAARARLPRRPAQAHPVARDRRAARAGGGRLPPRPPPSVAAQGPLRPRPPPRPGLPLRPRTRARRPAPRGLRGRAPCARAGRAALPGGRSAHLSRPLPRARPRALAQRRRHLRHAAACLVVLIAHTDSVPPAPGADDNASGVGTLVALAPASARSPGLRRLADRQRRRGAAVHRAGRPPRRARRRPAREAPRKDLRFVLSLDEVGRGTTFHLRSAANRPRVEGRILRAGRGAVRWVRTPAAATPTTASSRSRACRPPSSACPTSRAATRRATRPTGSSRRAFKRVRAIVERLLR